MVRTAIGVVLAVVLLTAGIGPATATNAQVGTVSAQVDGETCSFPVTATDATGTEVTVEDEPEQVVALGPSTAQTLWDVGAREKVVGLPVGPYTAYLNGSANRTDISQADGVTVATEQVVGAEPDLVLAPNIIPNETVETLRSAGLTVFKFGFGSSFADIYEKTNQTGRLVGTCEEAAETVESTRERVRTVREAVESEDSPRVLYPQSGGFVAGNGTFIHEVMETAGGDNIAANAGIQGYQQMSNETIAQRNPQWIVTANATAIPEGEPYASTTAVQQNQTVVVDSNLISQPGPRVVIPMTKIARQLHPEAMQQANLTNATVTAQPVAADGGNATAGTETAVATDGSTPAETTVVETVVVNDSATIAMDNVTDQASNGTAGSGAETETTSGNGAGFGVWVAAVALLGAALLVRRRT